jgi:hypothetical protein
MNPHLKHKQRIESPCKVLLFSVLRNIGEPQGCENPGATSWMILSTDFPTISPVLHPLHSYNPLPTWVPMMFGRGFLRVL